MGRKNWKSLLASGQKPYVRKAIMVVAALCAALVLTAFGIIAGLTKEVTVVLNGVEEQIKTEVKTVEELLAELEVKYTAHDYIHPELHTSLTSGMQVEWKQAVEITLDLYGQQKKRWTTADTVGEMLKEQGLSLEIGDKLEPAAQAKIRDQMLIELAHYTEEMVTEEQVFQYQTVRRHDATLIQGQQQVVTKGQDGKAVNKYKVTYKNGQEVGRELIGTDVLQERRDEVVAVGTKTVVSRGNYTFSPRSVLDNVTLTAYSAGAEHTGKSPDDPQYGLTRSGTRATDGQTIAVDPKLIPLGSWVYIDGIGLRRAEDTGGAVKGRKIDLYYEDNDQAKKFGTKKGYKVYVIGKQKPSGSK